MKFLSVALPKSSQYYQLIIEYAASGDKHEMHRIKEIRKRIDHHLLIYAQKRRNVSNRRSSSEAMKKLEAAFSSHLEMEIIIKLKRRRYMVIQYSAAKLFSIAILDLSKQRVNSLPRQWPSDSSYSSY